VAPLVILVLAAVRHAPKTARQIAAVGCCVAIVFSLAAQGGLVPGNSATTRTANLGLFHMPVLDSRGDLLTYAESGVRSCAALRPPRDHLTCHQYLEEWAAAAQKGTEKVWADATTRGRFPSVFFATQDRFFNTNTLGLDYQLEYHEVLPTGVLQPPAQVGASLARQLDSPAFGLPNLVIVGPPSTIPTWRTFSTIKNPAPVVAALRRTGFREIDRQVLPDRRVMQIWWNDRGAAASR
jgi:hypothetical protein